MVKHVVTETERVLAEMLTENTGSHMLDSGGAYGRNWERQQGKNVEDFLNTPECEIDTSFGYVTVNVFHWLNERVEYDEYWNTVFSKWVNLYDSLNEESGWLTYMEDFAHTAREMNYRYGDDFSGTYNSYNSEDSLSQVIQFTVFKVRDNHWRDGGEYFALLQIHGGCDVRGGYTAPRVFRIMGGYDGVCDMLDFDVYTLGHSAPEPVYEPHYLDRRNGEWITYEGSYNADPWDGGEMFYEGENGSFIRCPFCTEPTPMEAYAYPVG